MTDSTTTEPTRVQGFICLTRDLRWGWGATQTEAVKAARQAGSRDSAKGNRVIYALPAGAVNAWVDQMGQINWHWSDETPESERHVLGITVEEPKG